MRIDNNHFPTTENDKLGGAKKTDGRRMTEAKAVSVAQATATDSVQLSSKVREIADIALQLKESADVREDKVRELREQIMNGTYNVDGKSIASKILEKALGNSF